MICPHTRQQCPHHDLCDAPYDCLEEDQRYVTGLPPESTVTVLDGLMILAVVGFLSWAVLGRIIF